MRVIIENHPIICHYLDQTVGCVPIWWQICILSAQCLALPRRNTLQMWRHPQTSMHDNRKSHDNEGGRGFICMPFLARRRRQIFFGCHVWHPKHRNFCCNHRLQYLKCKNLASRLPDLASNRQIWYPNRQPPNLASQLPTAKFGISTAKFGLDPRACIGGGVAKRGSRPLPPPWSKFRPAYT